MKQSQLSIHALEGFSELDKDELKTVNGGSFWTDVAYATGVVGRCIWEFGRAASEFQASLPPSLKK